MAPPKISDDYFANAKSYFRRMAIPSDENRHVGNMAPAKTIKVPLLHKGFIFAGCPLLQAQPTHPKHTVDSKKQAGV
jgi:hypothetical protein